MEIGSGLSPWPFEGSTGFSVPIGSANVAEGDLGRPGIAVWPGAPESATYVYVVAAETLRRVAQASLTVLTAAREARASDTEPFDIEAMEGVAGPPPDDLQPFTFHFWTRGHPEKILLGRAHARRIHGANMIALYYQPDCAALGSPLTRVTVRLPTADPKDQVNPFPSIFIFTAGEGMARIGGRKLPVRGGESYSLPRGGAQKLWNPHVGPLTGILVMFGEDA